MSGALWHPPARRLGQMSELAPGTLDDLLDGTAAEVVASAIGDSTSARLAALFGVDLEAYLAAEKVSDRAGDVTRVPVLAPSGRSGLPARWLLAGVGAGRPQDLRRAGASVARAARGRAAVATSLGDRRPVEVVRALAEGLLLGGYTPPATGTRRRDDAAPVERITLLGRLPAGALEAGAAHARATIAARDLAATPSSVKTPGWMVEAAREAAAVSGLQVQVWDAAQLAVEGFGGLLAVGGASASPPALVRLDYRPPGPARTAGGRVVLVGKGITFDTGGISLKPRASMVPMKTDMSGAAAVLSVLAACRAAGVRRPVTGLLPLAENTIGADAYRPSDVVRIYGGRTVEIANTDAEGRIVLADALAYADARLDPDVLIDVATLTGAATLGLGKRHAALFTADDALARALTVASTASGERIWRMPLIEDYTPALRSTVADLRHVPLDAAIGGGAITAALFLRTFAGGRRWAHLDIAGPARADSAEHEVSKGATGYGARVLLRWLESLR